MRRAIGFGVFLLLVVGAVGGGLASRIDVPEEIRDAHDLGVMLTDARLGCGEIETDLPGVLGTDAKVGLCDVRGRQATLYVFPPGSSSGQMRRNYLGATTIAWAYKDNWVVVVDGIELALDIADRLDAKALYDPNSASTRLECPGGDLIQSTEALGVFGMRGFIGSAEEAVRVALRGLRSADQLLSSVGTGDARVDILRDGERVGVVRVEATSKGGWFVGSSSVCASSRILHG